MDRNDEQDVARALAAFDRLFEEGDAAGALEVADAALRRFPAEARLLHARGTALWELDEIDAAAAALRAACRGDDAPQEARIDLAILLLERFGLPGEALATLGDPAQGFAAGPHRAAAHAVRGQALLTLEDPEAGLEEVREAVRQVPDEPEHQVSLAEMEVEALDFDAATRSLERALRLDDENARAHWLRGFLLDRRGAGPAAQRAFETAARLAPEEYFVPVRLTEEEFDAHVEAALEEVPSRFRRHLDNIELAVETFPAEPLLREQRFSPHVLGLFLGTPITERSFEVSDLPPRILIFQRNLEYSCPTREELIHEIGITVRHEIGHGLGMEEDEIGDAGHG